MTTTILSTTLLAISILLFVPTISAAGSAGCGKKHDSGYHNASAERTIISDGIPRFYGIYVPNTYNNDPSLPRKVIFDYHGSSRTPEDQFNNSQYFKYPDGEEYLVVYPLGVDLKWQPMPGVTTNDLQYATDLLEHIRDTYCVDDNYIYASGKSAGGGFVDFLACHDAGDAFSAFAIASGALYAEGNPDFQCNKRRAVVESHGQEDHTISYYGGGRRGEEIPDIRTWIARWGIRDGCTNSGNNHTTIDTENGYETISYSCGGDENIVEHYDVYSLGHCWPSSSLDNYDAEKSTCKVNVLDYTPQVLKFFSRWSHGNSPFHVQSP